MGVSIGNKYHSIDGGYSMMFIIRKEIAYKFDEELGNHYAKMLSMNSPEERYLFNDILNTILLDDRFNDSNKDILDFLFMPDCEGKISYKTCKKIYELIKDVEDFSIGYAGTNQTFKDFKDILKECYSKRMSLRWY